MTTRLRWSALTLAAVLTAIASRASGVAQEPARATSSSASIDVRASRIFILVGKTGLGHEHGVEGRVKSGFLKLGATTDAGQIVFDTTTFQADTAEARQSVGLKGTTDADTQRQVNANMLGADVLDVRRHPTATFKIGTILPLRAERPNAPPQYQFEGEFTLHGTTRKLKFIAEAVPTTSHLRVRGKFSILQSDYGITPYSKAFGAIGVADQLTIWGDLWLTANAKARMIQVRRLQAELMDQPDLDPALHVHALRGLQRINAVSRSAAILWPSIAGIAQRVAPSSLRILDIACGGGDNAIALARRAMTAGLPVEIDGCDISPCAILEARRRADDAAVKNVRFFNLDVIEGPLPADYHVLTCSLFLHHLEEGTACSLIKKMAECTSDTLLICDLQRSWLGYGLAWIGCRLLTRSPIVHVDGPRSVAAAFAVDEIGSLAARSGLEDVTLTHHWPQRWLLTWRKQ